MVCGKLVMWEAGQLSDDASQTRGIHKWQKVFANLLDFNSKSLLISKRVLQLRACLAVLLLATKYQLGQN